MTDYSVYLSPFSWRYGSEQMRQIWSERNKRLLWRKIWVAVARVQSEYDLVSAEQIEDLQANMGQVDIQRSLEMETEVKHDLVAELRVFAEQCVIGGKILHLGLTSMDIVDNADVLRIAGSTELVLERMVSLLEQFADLVDQWADVPVMAFTHLQPAEPTTLGYRLAQYTQELLIDYRLLRYLAEGLRAKGFRGAVGSSAALADLIGEANLDDFERKMSLHLGIGFFNVTTQTYTRKQDYLLLSELASIGSTLHKFAFDLRLLQSPMFGELSEPFGSKQVGSSAMPFKRNPVQAEKINSLARLLAQFPRTAWDNAANSLLERTLDDSANRRTTLPEAFLVTDELLSVTGKILAGLRVDEASVHKNLETYGPFSATERVLAACVKAGGDRQKLHERLRTLSMKAWQAIQNGSPNPIRDLIIADELIGAYLPAEAIRSLMDIRGHIGDAARQARKIAGLVREAFRVEV